MPPAPTPPLPAAPSPLDPSIATSVEKLARSMKLPTEATYKLEAGLSKLLAKTEKTSKSFGVLKKNIAETEKNVKDLENAVDKLTWEKKLPYDQAIRFKKEMKEINKTLRKVDPKNIEAYRDALENADKELLRLRIDLEGSGKVSKEVFESMSDGVASFGNMFTAIGKKSPAGLKSAAGSAEKVAGSLGKWGKDLEGTKGLMGAMGVAAKGLGTSLGGVTKLLGGWPGLILMAVKGLADFVLDADQFVKDQNKIFALMRGPDIMTPNVEKQFKEFNDQIFKMSENIKVGFNVKQIQEFFNAVNQAGLNITTLNRGLYDYRDAVYIAAKASKTLGMDLPYIGAQMGDLITNFRANLKQVDEAFIQVAFDAGKSGLSTDRFWTAVKNATAGMAMYGLFIKAASKTMKAFTESQVMGAEDASKATDEMYDVFKKGSLKSKFAVVQFAGGITDAFKDKVKELQTGETEIKGKIKFETDKASPNVQELMKLRKELAANQALQLRAQAAADGNQLAQVNELTQVSDKAPEIVTRALEKIVGRPLDELKPGELYTVLQQASEKIGISTDIATKMVNVAIANRKELEGLSDALDKGLESLDAGQKERLSQIAGSNADVADALEKGDIPLLKKLLKDAKVRRAVEKANFEADTATQTEMANSAEQTFEQINKQTLSYKDMIDIAKDEVKWRAMSLGIFRGLNTGVNNIIGLIRKGGAKTESEKMAIAELAKTKEAKAAGFKGGDLTDAMQRAMAASIGQQLGSIDKNIAYQKSVSKMIKESATPEDAMAGLQKEFDKQAGNPRVQEDIRQAMERMTKLTSDEAKKWPIDKQKKQMKEIASFNNKMIDDLEAQKKPLEDSRDKLTELNKTNDTIAKIQEELLTSSPEASKDISDSITDQMSKGTKFEDAVSNLGLDMKTALKAMSKTGALSGLTGKLGTSAGRLLSDMKTSGEIAPMATGGIVTRPTPILAGEKGREAIVPLAGGGPGVGGPGGMTGGKNISITVNATEKDLAAKIANEVRAVLYKESLI